MLSSLVLAASLLGQYPGGYYQPVVGVYPQYYGVWGSWYTPVYAPYAYPYYYYPQVYPGAPAPAPPNQVVEHVHYIYYVPITPAKPAPRTSAASRPPLDPPGLK